MWEFGGLQLLGIHVDRESVVQIDINILLSIIIENTLTHGGTPMSMIRPQAAVR